MSSPLVFRRASGCVLGAYGLFFVIATLGVFRHGWESLYAENGPMENAQAVVLGMATLCFCLALKGRPVAQKLVFLVLATLTFGCMLREVNLREVDGAPAAFKWLTGHAGRTPVLAVAFAVEMAVAVPIFGRFIREGTALLRSMPGRLLITGLAFMVLGEVFEKHLLVPHHVFFEESAELLGYCLVWIAAIKTLSRSPEPLS